MDWKDALASLQGLPEGPAEETSQENYTVSPEGSAIPHTSGKYRQADALHILMEKKGRGGKTATIVEGFTISDEEIDDVARTLRKKLGTGGSARGGEILIQGDRRDDVRRLLSEMGFRCKG